MAYNILKGSVEGSVDQHGDQKIEGVKVFKSTISASVFYDTDAQSPCATMKDVAIKEIKGGSENSILVLGPESTAKAPHNLKFQNETLHVKNIKTDTIKGSAEKMTAIPTDKFVGKINASFISFGESLTNTRNVLEVKAADGLKVDERGISVNIAPASCLSLVNDKLTINATKSPAINSEGQNLSDADLLMVHDVSRNTIVNTTLKNLFASYINLQIPHAQGRPGSIQIKGRNEFEASDNLRYESKNKTLNVEGRVVAEATVSQLKTVNEGAVYHNICNVDDKKYDVNSTDYTIICDASRHKVIVKLPPAQNHTGRVLIIKKSNSDKYKINSNLVEITCDEGRIDINNKVEIKMNFSSKTFQSDGENWWIIGNKGS